MTKNQKILLIIIGIVAFFGIYFLILLNAGVFSPNSMNDQRIYESFKIQCEETYLGDGFESVEDCAMHEMARFEMSEERKMETNSENKKDLVSSFNSTITEMTKSYDGENCNLSENPKVCFVTSFENCTNAIYSEISYTIEGDPILSIRQINSANPTSCSIDFFVDTTADNFGVGSKSKIICHEVSIDEKFNNYLRMNECEKSELWIK